MEHRRGKGLAIPAAQRVALPGLPPQHSTTVPQYCCCCRPHGREATSRTCDRLPGTQHGPGAVRMEAADDLARQQRLQQLLVAPPAGA